MTPILCDQGGSMSPATPREVFDRAISALQDSRMDTYSDLFAEDAVFELPFAPPGVPRRIQGKDAIHSFIGAGASRLEESPPRWTMREIVVHETTDPEVIVTEFQVHGTFDNSPYQFENLQVLTVRDGEILRLRDYWNPLDRRELSALTHPDS
jgi:ketosteroid isomerase-like protein